MTGNICPRIQGSDCIVHEILSASAAEVLKGWRINTDVGKYHRFCCLGFPSSSALMADTSIKKKNKIDDCAQMSP